MSLDLSKLNGLLWAIWAAYWIYSARNTKRDIKKQDQGGRLAHLAALIVGFSLIFAVDRFSSFALANFSSISLQIVGCLVTLAGQVFCVWARHHLGQNWSGTVTLKENHALVRSGPYKISRHPIYTGFLFSVIGSALTSGTGIAFLGLMLITASYLRKIRIEEAVLSKQFGEDYSQFQADVPMLFPKIY